MAEDGSRNPLAALLNRFFSKNRSGQFIYVFRVDESENEINFHENKRGHLHDDPGKFTIFSGSSIILKTSERKKARNMYYSRIFSH